MRLAYLLLACLPVLGQAPPAPPVTKAPGDKVRLDILVNSQPSKAPVALKWNVIFPVQVMEMEGDAEIDKAATEAGKTLQCSSTSPYALACTLSGGRNPIASGRIATFHFRIRSTAKAGRTTLRVEGAQATTADSSVEALSDTDSVVIIR